MGHCWCFFSSIYFLFCYFFFFAFSFACSTEWEELKMFIIWSHCCKFRKWTLKSGRNTYNFYQAQIINKTMPLHNDVFELVCMPHCARCWWIFISRSGIYFKNNNPKSYLIYYHMVFKKEKTTNTVPKSWLLDKCYHKNGNFTFKCKPNNRSCETKQNWCS